MDELYLENIDELVTDQNKIVTYKWLSHTLGVHVNQAKQMLYDYVTRKRKENQSAQVHVTYLLTGKSIQNGYPYHKVAVVKEEKLEAMKAKLAVVANVHVYSIQKATLKDSAPLFNTDYDIFKNNLQDCNKYSAIRCAEAVPRSAEVMSQLRKAHSQQTEEAPQASAPTINGHIPPPAAKTASQQPKGIMGMFSRPAAKAQEANKEPKTENKEPAVSTGSSKSSAKANAMNNFFGKASLSKIKETSSINKSVKQEEEPVSPSTASSQAPASSPPPEPPTKKGTSTKVPTKTKKSKGKRAEISDSEEEENKLVKKRRRIKQPMADSSDDEDVPAPRDVKTPSPPPAPEPVLKMETDTQPQVLPGGKRRKRKRVLKSKTFMDEEGCIVTEKVYESQSCTDSEDEFAVSKPAGTSKPFTLGTAKQEVKTESKPPKKSSVANKGTKQASIMGFFQKK
ncbi:DNA polymerase delta subunit 3 [Pelobates fuscus]|uniref:DNA polymerase delta subunit 3 n=1 Tax=Pelobates fuscus TaxID=191477 RepID=UPI002FE47915